MEKDAKEPDDDISELITKMAKLDVTDTTYLAMWVQLIRRVLELQHGNLLQQLVLNVTASRTSPVPRTRDPPPHLNRPTREREEPPRGYGMRCFGCGQIGHPASRCEEIDKFIRDRIIERNGLGRAQWKDGSKIFRTEDETLVDVIKRGTKKANLIMVACKEPAGGTKQIYLQAERFTSDEEGDAQEEVWLNATALDVLEAESYGVQRSEKISRGIRGADRGQDSRMKAKRADDTPGRGNLVRVGTAVVVPVVNFNPITSVSGCFTSAEKLSRYHIHPAH